MTISLLLELYQLWKCSELNKEQLQKCLELEFSVRCRGLFSSNDESRDLSSESVAFLLTDFFTASCHELCMDDRERHLEVAKALYFRFFERLIQYKLFDDQRPEYKVLCKYLTLDFDEAEEEKFIECFKSPTRDLKIERAKAIMSAKKIIDSWSIPTATDDDEKVLAYWTFVLNCASLCALENLSLLLKELELLQMGKSSETVKTEPLMPKNISKISRPFKLVRDRKQVADSVFRPDYNLPTMTIDEYLDLEMKRGNIISGGGPASAVKAEVDEDNETYLEQQLIKDREWDEFKDTYKRGSGNTFNRS